METQNPYLVKKTISFKKIVEEEVEIIDWTLVPSGTFMTAKIDGIYVEGVLYKEATDFESKMLYFCQNVKPGIHKSFKFGYEYSWLFMQRTDGTHNPDVTDIQFPPKPANLILPPIPPEPIFMEVGEYYAKVYSDYIKIDCQTISKETVLKVLANMEEHAKLTEQTN